MGLKNLIENLEDAVRYEMDEEENASEVTPETLEQVRRAFKDAPRRPAVKGDTLQRVTEEVAACTLCDLHTWRTKTVPGQGAANAEIFFIGEGPGADEDRQGIAFIGRAGQLLTKMIQAMGLTRDEVFIGNIVKCRPPSNRTPHPDEMHACMPYLKRQIALIKPKVIVALGSTAAKGLLDVSTGITKLRGNWRSFEGIDLMPTFHPAYLLRNPSAKHEAWADLKAVLKRLGRTPPPVRKRKGR